MDTTVAMQIMANYASATVFLMQSASCPSIPLTLPFNKLDQRQPHSTAQIAVVSGFRENADTADYYRSPK
jgi:hypothetical protein